jgi:hypothetical protein
MPASLRVPQSSQTHQLIVQVLRAYTDEPLTVTEVESYEDPQHYGVFAARLLKLQVEFLVRPWSDQAEQVEEVQFTSWPPTFDGGR